ncbi:cbb3-type cytochrome oxidase assembly protein CcoS [Halomonas sp. I1]|uniref:cbb3-type cytochrome oxidase assembly protein CcoS n=1 Tax=Halomonas sp. I1 TaxID=393536 RepID=UPI0028DF26B0|nr:cbb3-type cytochrome oxidase assembly protein CcoS [Halomonas sp. I1]MDT8894949.1 cbb3-type cytochrome oxidase assembly protein CcoS [Halomonas sp. I1]
MSVLYLLIPLSLVLLGLAVWAFFWAVNNDQFDDLEGPAYRILFDEDDPPRTRPDRPQDNDATLPPRDQENDA